MTNKEKNIINNYFKDFVMKHKNISFVNENNEVFLNEIKKSINPEFDKNWNYLMLLVEIIENIFSVRGIRTKDNYVGFDFEDNETIQDKGISKLEAFYLVCFKTIKQKWENGKIEIAYRNIEPFDLKDLE